MNRRFKMGSLVEKKITGKKNNGFRPHFASDAQKKERRGKGGGGHSSARRIFGLGALTAGRIKKKPTLSCGKYER